MKYIITIDAGSTNTRAYLWDEARRLIASARSETGVHVTAAEGNNLKLKQAVKDCLNTLLRQGGIGYADVSAILASGMITSNLGLYELPHVSAPAGAKELAQGSRAVLLEDICPVPIRFLPGVKNGIDAVSLENFEAMDMMRGEEVEALAILQAYPKGLPYLLVLPGSHTKFVAVDALGRITGCLTTITGELLDCITNHTVIADSVGRKFAREDGYNREMLLRGFETAQKTGLGRGAFAARILNQFVEADREEIAFFLLGAALASDVKSVQCSAALAISPDVTVIVSGKNPLRRALADVLCCCGSFQNVEQYVPDPTLPLSAEGSFLEMECITSEMCIR